MLQSICNWIEQYSGMSYDFNESDYNNMFDELAFIDTFDWYNRYLNIRDNLVDVLEIVDDYARELPEDLPSPIELKKLISDTSFDNMCNMINIVKRQLGFEITPISSFSDLGMQAAALANLISFVRENSIEDIIKHKLFEKHEEDNDNMFTDILMLKQNDLTAIRFAIDDIRTTYFESLEEDD